MGAIKAPSEQENKTSVKIQGPENASSLGETKYLDSRASTLQLMQLQAAADEQGKGNRLSQLQSKSDQFTGASRIAQLQAKSNSRMSSAQLPIVQREKNTTRLPDGLKSAMGSYTGPSTIIQRVIGETPKFSNPQKEWEGKKISDNDAGAKTAVAQLQGEAPAATNTAPVGTPSAGNTQNRFQRNEEIALESKPKTFGEKTFGGGAESATNQVATAGDMNDLAESSFGKIEGDFEAALPTVDQDILVVTEEPETEETNSKVLSDFGLNEEAQNIAGAVTGSLVSVYDLVEKGKAAMEDKKDVTKWIDLLLSATSAANTAWDICAKYKVVDEIPVVGSAIEAAKLGLELFRNNKAINLLKDTELAKKENNLTEKEKEDKKVLDRYMSKVRVDLASTAFDFILTLGQIAGGFFPPADKFVSITKGIKGLFEKGFRAWQAYKAEKEQQALARLNLDEEQLSSANKEDLKNLSEKMGQDGETPSLGEGSGTTVFSLVQLQIEYKSKENEANLATTNIDQKRSEATLAKTKLTESIATYNSTLASTGSVRNTITENDIIEIQKFHEDTIKSIINQVNTEISLWNSFRRGMSFFSNRVLTDKDKILKTVWKGQQPPNESLVQELSKGQDAGYFWGKTKAAMEKASKDREHFTKEELGDRLKKILKDTYAMTEDQLKPIFDDFADVTTSRNTP